MTCGKEKNDSCLQTAWKTLKENNHNHDAGTKPVGYKSSHQKQTKQNKKSWSWKGEIMCILLAVLVCWKWPDGRRLMEEGGGRYGIWDCEQENNPPWEFHRYKPVSVIITHYSTAFSHWFIAHLIAN